MGGGQEAPRGKEAHRDRMRSCYIAENPHYIVKQLYCK